MKKIKKVESIDAEIVLPEAIIHRIQCFLSGKEAAQTSVLAKSWYSAWLTRPNLDFDEHDFPMRLYEEYPDESALAIFAKNTMRRYEDSKLKIESLRLFMNRVRYRRVSYICQKLSVAEKLIAEALNLGATDIDFKIEIERRGEVFSIRSDVLESETLVRLSVVGCLLCSTPAPKVNCSRLKYLNLIKVRDKSIIRDIIAASPLIEELVIIADCFDAQYKLHNLKLLRLENGRITASFFCDFSSRFPCLKVLAIHRCFHYNYSLEIYSNSLECISFTEMCISKKTEFNVPKIRKFEYSGPYVPSLTFRTTSKEWESNVSLNIFHYHVYFGLENSWFLDLKKFMLELSSSRVTLSLNTMNFVSKIPHYGEDIIALPKPPIVEKLKLSLDPRFPVCYALLRGVFRSCRPKFLTLYWSPYQSKAKRKKDFDFAKLLCKTLIKEERADCFIPNRNMLALRDLEEVNAEFFEENNACWRPLPWNTFRTASADSGSKKKSSLPIEMGGGFAMKLHSRV
ncbi:hypothetical protein ACS0TY_026490 [Phlomoides rotata]